MSAQQSQVPLYEGASSVFDHLLAVAADPSLIDASVGNTFHHGAQAFQLQFNPTAIDEWSYNLGANPLRADLMREDERHALGRWTMFVRTGRSLPLINGHVITLAGVLCSCPDETRDSIISRHRYMIDALKAYEADTAGLMERESYASGSWQERATRLAATSRSQWALRLITVLEDELIAAGVKNPAG